MARVYTHFTAVQKAKERVLQEPFTQLLLIGSIAPDSYQP